MKRLLVCLGFLFSISAFAQVLPTEQQIKEATMALPEADRLNAKIWGYNADGELVELQKGVVDTFAWLTIPTKRVSVCRVITKI